MNGADDSHAVWTRHAAGSLEGMHDVHVRVREEIIAAVEEAEGRPAAETLRSLGLEFLHSVITPTQVAGLRNRVLDRLREDLLRLAVTVGRSGLDWPGEFYVDDYLVLRINFPYAIAKHADFAAENPGVGRVSPSMRDAAAARRVKDPIYDPRAYHRGHPPAAWAHGPHIDSWTGHSRDGRNIWWAICDVPAEAGMVLYPELAGQSLPCDRASLYLKSGYRLPKPTFVPLSAGEMLVFDPEVLHGTHLNVTDRTRVAVSMRLNASKPTFDPDCFYAREFWRRASDIEAGELDRVLHLKREDNLAPLSTVPPAAPPEPLPTVRLSQVAEQSVVRVAPVEMLGEGGRIVAEFPDRCILVLRHAGGLTAVDAACPHYGINLADGAFDGTTLYCPACAVGFDVETKCSAGECLRLASYQVYEREGWILLAFADAVTAGTS